MKLNPKELELVKMFVKENLAKGFIHKSKSPQSTRVFFIPKKDTMEKHFIMDYHHLNKYTK